MYRPTRRNWIKLWVEPWLEGSTRYELTDIQRAFWVDLLAMAARSRTPGTVCSSRTNEQMVGYPISKYQSLVRSEIDILETFRLLEATDKAKIFVTHQTPISLYAVEIVNWNKYQSRYLQNRSAQSRYDSKRYKQTSTHVVNEVRANCNQTSTVEVEGELEVEGEGEEKKRKLRASAPAEPSRFAFSGSHFRVGEVQDRILGDAFPWLDRVGEYRKADSWLEANPRRRPKNRTRFLHNWFERASQSSKGDGHGRKPQGEDLTRANLRAAGFMP